MATIFIMDAAISHYRQNKKSWGLPLAIWTVAAFFSIASNFNFLYTNFMRADVVLATTTEQLAVFRDNLVDTRVKLTGLDSMRTAESLRAELVAELENLNDQINDPL